MKRSAKFLGSIILQAFLFGVVIAFVNAQSTEQNFPTPITQNELTSKISARDIGDSRLTTYYFTFNGNQGDIFISVKANNLNGDLDIFEAETLRPISKIRLFADFSADEITRSIYLRKSEKLLLRIEGRTPNDDPATFTIQFTGNFVASSESAIDESAIPKVVKKTEGETEVNSVGTIIAVKPKETTEPNPRVEIAKATKPKKPSKRKTVEVPKIEIPKIEIPKITIPKIKKPKVEVTKPKTQKPKKEKIETVKPPVVDKPSKTLIVTFQDGTSFQKPMSEILKFSIERETLTIISKTGEIKRYSISDVVKLAIE
jgi:hypothetical protein